MKNLNYLSWTKFYSEFATKLLDYSKDRSLLVEKIMKIYKDIGIQIPKLEKDNDLKDIDPFTAFGLFNKRIKDENRIKILKAVANEFFVKSDIPQSFEGIPILNNQKATFYYFIGEREEHDIDNLWAVFEAALNYSDKQSEKNKAELIKYYDKVQNQIGVRWNITMGLYWIRPYTFLNLDSRNREFIIDPKNLPEDFIKTLNKLKSVPSGEQYIQICEDCNKILKSGDYPYDNFPELSYSAWQTTIQVQEDEDIELKAEFLKWFRPLLGALKELGGSATPAEARRQIIKNEKMSDEEVSKTRGKTKVNKFENEVAFARSYLVVAGYIDNSVHGIWSLTEKGKSVEMTDKLTLEIYKSVAAAKQPKAIKPPIEDNTVRYWIYSPGENASYWEEFYKSGIMGIGWGDIGDLKLYKTKDQMKKKMKECYGEEYSYKNSAHATWQFANDMKPGDIVFVKKGMHLVLGRGVVTSEYEYKADETGEYLNQRKVNWTDKGEWKHPGQAAMKVLTDITSFMDYVSKLNALFEEDMSENVEEKEVSYPVYTPEDFLEDVYMSMENYVILTNLLRNKKNIILQGAPGVGKTYAARRLAYSMIQKEDKERAMMIQFHQSYSYEDFIMGFRPSSTGFELKKGPFYNFCKKAEIDSENEYFFIIDEINRGNLSKIFGELFMLIENDKRGIELQLLYSDEKFSIPENVYIIGMMNTADRGLAMLDYALRRRFAFFEFSPAFDTEGFIKYRVAKNNSKFDKLIDTIERLNIEIEKDQTLGRGFRIGHSYFCTDDEFEINDMWLNSLVAYELVPLINEYWFDEPGKVEYWTTTLTGAIK